MGVKKGEEKLFLKVYKFNRNQKGCLKIFSSPESAPKVREKWNVRIGNEDRKR